MENRIVVGLVKGKAPSACGEHPTLVIPIIDHLQWIKDATGIGK